MLQQFIQEVLFESNDRFRQNINKIVDYLRNEMAKAPSKQTAISLLKALKFNKSNRAIKNVAAIKQLHNNDIVDIIGHGAEGIAVLLPNNRILKLLLSPIQDDVGSTKTKYIEKMQDPTDLDVEIYDVGRGHIELEKVMAFDEWLKKSGKSALYGEEMFDVAWNIVHHEHLQSLDGYSNEDVNTISLISKAIKNELVRGNSDAHEGNLGVKIVDGKEKFIFFDF